jgi:chromate transporter
MASLTVEDGNVTSGASPSFGEALRTWARIGVLSFGGPTAQIALMHRIIVDEKKWLTERQYLDALSFCMLLPGPEAMQLATYAGWRLHGTLGGLAAGLLFVVPGALVVLALAMIYASFGNLPVVAALFFGIKAAVVVIVVEALLRVSRRALKGAAHWLTAAVAFVAIFFADVPFPIIVALAALMGLMMPAAEADPASRPVAAVALARTAGTVGLWLAIWIIPLLALALIVGRDHVLVQLSLFFSKLAIVTFGGAYSVLAYMAQAVVEQHGWLEPGQMLDGLGLAETTPGPLILVTEFVGYLAAYRHGGQPGILMGLAGALVALWATFVPCFLWIFAGAPYIAWIISKPRLRGALTFITAAVVGVILNLAVWFALHVFFADVSKLEFGLLKIWLPSFSTFDWSAAALAVLSSVLLLHRHWNIAPVLAVAGGLGLAMKIGGV